MQVSADSTVIMGYANEGDRVDVVSHVVTDSTVISWDMLMKEIRVDVVSHVVRIIMSLKLAHMRFACQNIFGFNDII